MSGIGFGEVVFGIEHQGIVGFCVVGFEFSQDGSELVARVNALVENICKGASLFDCDEEETIEVVNGCFMLREDEEGASFGIDARVESGSVFESARNGETDVD